MSSVAIVSVLIGALLGGRYKVMVLVPLIGIILVVTLAAGYASDAGGWSTLLIGLVIAGCVQLGYVLGVLSKYLLDTGPRRRVTVNATARSLS